MDADQEPEEGEVSRVVNIEAKGRSCSHCGHPGGHKRRKCPHAVYPEKNGGRCSYCCDMAHRREKPKCRGCKEPFEPEVVIHKLPSPGSGLGDA